MYVYIYIYIHLVHLGNHQDVFLMVSVVDIIQRFVNGFRRWLFAWFLSSQETFVYGFRRWFSMVSVMAGNIVFVHGFHTCNNKRRLRRAEDGIIVDLLQIHRCAGNAQTYNDNRIAMFSLTVADPDLTSGLRFIQSRARALSR